MTGVAAPQQKANDMNNCLSAAQSHLRRLVAACAILVMAGCAAPNVVYHSGTALPPPLHPKLTVLRPDAVVSLHTAGGLLEPRADWSENATQSLAEGVRSHLFDAGIDFTDAPAGTDDDEYAMWQSINLVLDAVELLTVKGAIGDARTYVMDKAQRERVAEATGADYALATIYRSNRGSGGRILVAMLPGTAVQVNSARFRCALIDLRDGHVKWANFDSAGVAAALHVDPDKTRQKVWRRAVDVLMRGFPL